MSEEERPAGLPPGVPIIKLSDCDCRRTIHPDGSQSVEIHVPTLEMGAIITEHFEKKAAQAKAAETQNVQ